MFDTLIRNATVVDGTGQQPHTADVGIIGDRIEAVGNLQRAQAAQAVDGTGLVLSPGFVDIHTHADFTVTEVPDSTNFIHQGVTTMVGGNCGHSMAPGKHPSLADFFAAIEEQGTSANFCTYVGHGTVREAVMGLAPGTPNDEQRRQMRRQVARALDEGAIGLSTGLIYVPNIYSDLEEIIWMTRVLHSHDAVYASHIRGEGETVFEAVAEAIEVGRRTGLPVQISHLKLESSFMWGRAPQLLELVLKARDEGVRVNADQYPYAAYSTFLSSFLPPSVDFRTLPLDLKSESLRRDLRQVVAEGLSNWTSSLRGVGWDRVLVIRCESNPNLVGKTLQQAADEAGQDPFDLFFSLMETPLADTSIIGFAMDEGDVRTILAQDWTMVGSDGSLTAPGQSLVHPRAYGTFPRVLGHYVRDQKVLPLERAVRKMTALPAEALGLRGRGYIRSEHYADLVLFDPRTIIDTATFTEPHQTPRGIVGVWVNGVRVIADGRHLGTRPGRVLRKGAA